MFRNYLNLTLRLFWRNKFYTFINILGLSLAIACALLLYLYVMHEFSYDQIYADNKQIYRVGTHTNVKDDQKDFFYSSSGYAFAETAQKECSEWIESSTKVFQGTSEKPITYGKRKLFLENVLYVEPSYFKVFSHKFLQGKPEDLAKPFTMVLTQQAAKDIFGSVRAAIGKEIKVFDDQKNRVVGIIEDLPHNVHFRFSALISFATLEVNDFISENNLKWLSLNYPTYLKLKSGASKQYCQACLEKKILPLIIEESKKINFEIGGEVVLQPLRDIHLPDVLYQDEIANVNQRIYMYIFLSIGFFVLVVACINYMNLATARSVSRSREVGIRKVSGALRHQLIQQFLFESFLLVTISLMFALLVVELTLPWFNWLTDVPLKINYRQDYRVWLIIGAIFLGVGFLSGLYPAFFLSSFDPITVLKGNSLYDLRYASLRKILVVFQFTISLGLIISTWIIYEQLSFIREKDLGYEREHTLVIRNFNFSINPQMEEIKRELLEHPNILKVATADVQLNNSRQGNAGVQAEQENGDFREYMTVTWGVDKDFFKAMGIKLSTGRNFKTYSDTSRSVIVNETYIKKLKLKTPLGKRLITDLNPDTRDSIRYYEIVGVVKDINFASLRYDIQPAVFFFNPAASNLYIQLKGKAIDETLTYVKKTWLRYEKLYPYRFSFLTENLELIYQDDLKRGQVFLLFSLLSILIACMGLLGLSSFLVEQKAKEVGVRKVLGASVNSILWLISRDFIRLILFASILAIPLAYYIGEQWLDTFAYRISISPLAFIVPLILVLMMAVLSVIWQAFKIAHLNPSEVLNHE